MRNDQIIYEQPLNERIRSLLRLEFLLRRAHASLPVPSPWAARTVLESLLQIMELLSRFDARQDLLKHLERHQQHLHRIRRSPKASAERVDSVLSDIQGAQDALHGQPAAVGHALRAVEILNGLRQSAMVPGGHSGFEHPYLHHWLHLDSARRERDLTTWLGEFATLDRALALVLWLVRAAAEGVERTAQGGFYNQTLSRAGDYQLVRVALPASSPWFVNISGNPMRVTIRFMTPTEDLTRAAQASDDIDFSLTLCPGIHLAEHKHA